MDVIEYESEKSDKPSKNGNTNFMIGAFWCAAVAGCLGVGSCLSIDSRIFILPGVLLLGCWLFGGIGVVLSIADIVLKKRKTSILLMLSCLGIIIISTAVFNHLDHPTSGVGLH
jgi:hypothetical protein